MRSARKSGVRGTPGMRDLITQLGGLPTLFLTSRGLVRARQVCARTHGVREPMASVHHARTPGSSFVPNVVVSTPVLHRSDVAVSTPVVNHWKEDGLALKAVTRGADSRRASEISV